MKHRRLGHKSACIRVRQRASECACARVCVCVRVCVRTWNMDVNECVGTHVRMYLLSHLCYTAPTLHPILCMRVRERICVRACVRACMPMQQRIGVQSK